MRSSAKLAARLPALLALIALPLVSASASAALPPQGQNIGDPTGRSGLWPLLETPPGNTFQSSATDDYFPQIGSESHKKYLLGKALFWDEQLSSDNTMACGTCHFPEAAGIDPRGSFLASNKGFGSLGVLPQNALNQYVMGTPTSQQENVTGVIAPTMLGAAFAERLFWDVRAGPNFTFENGAPITLGGVDQFANFAALEDQSINPPMSDTEMAHQGIAWNVGEIEGKLGTTRPLLLASSASIPTDLVGMVASGDNYARIFDRTFRLDPIFGGVGVGVTRERFAAAVAAYERTLIPNKAAIDTRALTVIENNGFQHLLGSQCFRCHSNQTVFFGNDQPQLTGTGGFVNALDAMLTDSRRHGNIGFPSPPGASGTALGSFNVKTPSLRNVLLKPSLTHNGFFTNIDDLLAFYNAENGFNPTFPFTTGSLPQGRLNANEKLEVKAFFRALTDPRLISSSVTGSLNPPFDRPDLYSERFPMSAIELPGYHGTPPPGSLRPPDIIADPPLLASGDHFKIGVRDAPVNEAALLLISPNPLPIPIPAGPLMLNTSGLITFATSTDVDGFATFINTSMVGLLPGQVFSAQWIVRHSPSGGSAFSNAAEFVVQ